MNIPGLYWNAFVSSDDVLKLLVSTALKNHQGCNDPLFSTRRKGHESALLNSLVVLVDISTNIIPLYKLVLMGSMEKFSLPTGGRLRESSSMRVM